MSTEVLASICEIRASEWNALAGETWPFLRHEFLSAAETGGSVSALTGWQPCHLLIRDRRGKAIAAMPLYEKTHSWGEFVFDWAWAQAYHRLGIDYYPKMVSAVPFTPAPCRKLLIAGSNNEELSAELLDAALLTTRERNCSSLHLQFPLSEELGLLREAGLLVRKDCQFHWHNRGYANFDDFLAKFSSAKRRKAKQDRRRVREQGFTFRWLHGDQIDGETWKTVYELISITFRRRGSLPYFNLDFFIEISRLLPRHILVVIAELKGNPVAAAVFYVGATTLYGRYWGADSDYDALHFETCYYQGIDFCIQNGIQVFEPGTQGEHKISRGFQPVTTWSAHWIARAEFSDAIGRFLQEERRHIEQYIDAVNDHSPYRAKENSE